MAIPTADERGALVANRHVDAPSRRWAVGLWLAAVAMAGAGLALAARSDWSDAAGGYGFPGFTALFALSYGSIGAFVLWRRPGNRVGVVLLAAGLLSGAQTLWTEYGVVGLITAPGSLPYAVVGAWLVSWGWVPFVFLGAPVLFSIFPDGQLLSRRWGLLLALVGLAGAGFMVLTALRSGPLENFVVVDNPVGVIPRSVEDTIARPLISLLAVGVLGPAMSLMIRYHRSGPERRQQLKWFALAGVLVAIVAPLGFTQTKPGEIAFILGLCGIPIATGVAVLRYGLYEIDLIINRAIVYGLLTAILAGLYAAAVGITQQAFRTITGSSSDGAVVISTLLVVTAFTPVKNWLQGVVDRRYKDTGDASVRLGKFQAELAGRLYPLDRERTLAAAVRLMCASVDSPGGLLELSSPVGVVRAAYGTPPGQDATRFGSGKASVILTAPRHFRAITDRDRGAIEATLEALRTELG